MRKRKAQSIMEYALLFGVIALAVVAMQAYFRQAVNTRLDDIRQEYVPK